MYTMKDLKMAAGQKLMWIIWTKVSSRGSVFWLPELPMKLIIP